MPDAPAPRTPDDAAAPSADDLRDRLLIARVARGDDAAFEQLVRLHRPRMLRIAERVIDGGRAEDAVQIALLRAYEAFRLGDVPRQPAAWLSAAVRNAAIDQHRRRGPVDPVAVPDAADVAPSVAAIAESRAELRRVLGDVAALPPNERDALLMRATTGAGHDAIGDELHVSPGQARQLLHRARRRLREVAAILLPAWLALRVSQARAAMANVAAAPSESLLGAKGTAVAIAAVATIGGGGAAVQAQRTVEHRASSAAGSPNPAAATAAAVPPSPSALIGPARTVAVASADAAPRAEDATSRHPERPGTPAEHARRTPESQTAAEPRTSEHRTAPSSSSAPQRPGSGGHDDRDGERRPTSNAAAGSSGSSGSSGSGGASPVSSSDSGSGSTGSSTSGSGSAASSDSHDDAPSTETSAPAVSDDDAAEASTDDHADDAEESTGRSEEVE